MPHGLSGFRARRLARAVHRHWLRATQELENAPDEAAAVLRERMSGMSFIETMDLQAYPLGRMNESTVAFGGTARMPDENSVIAAAESFGRTMREQDLIELAESVKRHGL